MFTFDLNAKLKRLNPDLFINESSGRVAGIYRRFGGRSETVTGLEHLETGARKYMEDLESGAKPEFVCGCPKGEVPEYDQFDLKEGKMLARGWRSIIKILHEKKLIDITKARNLFACGSLAQDEYDRLSFEGKLRWARGLRYA